ncbi:1347_t:CDS:2, partial [Acaulospora morrowiae]
QKYKEKSDIVSLSIITLGLSALSHIVENAGDTLHSDQLRGCNDSIRLDFPEIDSNGTGSLKWCKSLWQALLTRLSDSLSIICL